VEVVGVVLAGGAGRRMGGDKALVEHRGRPMLRLVLDALLAVCGEVAVVAKRDTALPPLDDRTPVWREPDEPRHPLTGIVHALRLAGGRPVLAVAVDLPALDPPTLRLVLDAALEHPAAQVVLPVADGRRQPLCALYRASALDPLAAAPPDVPMARALEALRVTEVVLA
jgi:molybdenum cofactor guanylyltransferase